MNILLVVSHFPPRWTGGAEISAQNLAEILADEHMVTVLTRGDSSLPQTELRDRYRVIRIRIIDLPLMRFASFLLQALLHVHRRRKEIDIIHAQMILPNGLVAILAKVLYGIKCAVAGVGGDVYSLETKAWGRVLLRLVLKSADVVVVQTNHMRRTVKRISGRDSYIVPPIVRIEKFSPQRKSEDPIILYLGRLSPVKGAKYAVLAMRYIKDMKIAAKLIVVGDGTERRVLEEIIEDQGLHSHVQMKGLLEYSKIPVLLSEAWVTVIPSLSEGFPNVILESYAAGTPVIASNVTGLPEIVVEGRTGYLVEPGNPKRIAERIIEIITAVDRGRMSDACVKEAERYSPKNAVEKLESIYKDLLGK
jgi:glycosyltransferase involved in cell wall biosynthesis